MTKCNIGCPRTWGTSLALGWLLACTSTASIADEDGAARGRRLFESGIGADGRPVAAAIADSATSIPGTLLSCAGCHGRDGKGRSTRGVDPPDITWQSLTKPYSVPVGAGRVRPPYTDALVVRAVTLGQDSGGRVLSSAMPRFRLTIEEAADLMAYLRGLGSTSDPGVGAEMLSIGILLPQQGNAAIRDAVSSYSEELNRSGGIFGRRVEFTFIAATRDGPSPVTRAAAIEKSVLAVIGSVAGTDDDVSVLASQSEVPLVAISAAGDTTGRQVFYLGAGLAGELRALATQAARQLDASAARLTILYRDDDRGRDLVKGLSSLPERDRWRAIDEVALPPGAGSRDLPEEVFRRIDAADALLVAMPDRGIGTILSAIGTSSRNPLVLLPGSVTAPQWLPLDMSPQMNILFGFDVAGLSASAAGERERPDLTSPAQHTLAAAQLVVEGLRKAGRDVTRARLIDAIETIQRFETGHLPPLSYAPRRHIGVTGAQIVPFDPLRRRFMEPLGRVEFD
jgi:ABC-type branched-subunit amino acid transport system substrate-binding protein